MNWVRAVAGVLVLWAGTAWGATLTWNANSETDLAGYRVYQCTKTPCTKTSGTASPLATLGKVTSFTIGTPAVTTYYFTTAYDFANNESNNSSLATFVPAGSPPPPSTSMGTVSLTVVGTPATGPWGVSANATYTQDVMAHVRLDGVMHHVENTAPWSFPGDNGTSVTTALFGKGTHTVEFVFYLQNTTTEVGRASISVIEGSTPTSTSTSPTVSLKVVGTPATGPWGVSGTTTSTQDVMATVRLDGKTHHVENIAPWSFPGDNGTSVTTALFGTGPHTVEFVYYLQNTTTEVGRASISVMEGSTTTSTSTSTPTSPTVSLKVVGTPATGPWGVSATTTNTKDLMATVRLDGNIHHVENIAPWSFPGDNGTSVTTALFGKGTHTVEFVFYLQNTTTEIGRASVTVKEGT